MLPQSIPPTSQEKHAGSSNMRASIYPTLLLVMAWYKAHYQLYQGGITFNPRLSNHSKRATLTAHNMNTTASTNNMIPPRKYLYYDVTDPTKPWHAALAPEK